METTPEKTVIITIKEIIHPKPSDTHVRELVKENTSTYHIYQNYNFDHEGQKSSSYWKW